MARELNESDWRSPFIELGDIVVFDHPYGGRSQGEVVRTYNGNPCDFHVEVDGSRYEINLHDDNVVRL